MSNTSLTLAEGLTILSLSGHPEDLFSVRIALRPADEMYSSLSRSAVLAARDGQRLIRLILPAEHPLSSDDGCKDVIKIKPIPVAVT